MGNNGDCDEGTFSCPECNGRFNKKEYFFFCKRKKLENGGNEDNGGCYLVDGAAVHGLFSRSDAEKALNLEVKSGICFKSSK
jgi:hypothetical protein